MKKGKLYILLAVLILMLVLSQSVCKTVTKLTSETMIEKAYAATLDITSFHISMCNNITGEGENEQCMEGDFQFPDRMRIVVDTDGQKREVRIIGDKIYERDFQIDEWQLNEGHLAQATQASVQRLAEEAQPKSIAERLKELEAIKELPGEIIDGVSCVHYRGKIDSLKGLREQLANESDPLSKVALQEMLKTQEQMEITIMVEFWIGEHDYLVHKQQRVQSWKDRGMTIIATSTIQFSNFNKLVEIEPPL